MAAASAAAINRNSDAVIAIEKAVTFAMGQKMANRGPPVPSQGGPQIWRGQVFRESSQRWGNRGGKTKNWTAYFMARGKGGGEEGGGGNADKGDKGGKGKGGGNAGSSIGT